MAGWPGRADTSVTRSPVAVRWLAKDSAHVHWFPVNAYLDHAATTPVYPQVAATFAEVAAQVGNPSSLHAHGRAARRRLEEAREQVAAELGAHPTEVIFTAGGTEADNLAVSGVFTAQPECQAVVISAVEHPAVGESAHALAGAQVREVGVDAHGLLRLDDLAEQLSDAAEQVALVSVMWANNETGTIQPIREVADLARAHGVRVHSDAVQAIGRLPVDFAASDLDALSLSGHKLGAPVGIGALLARRDLPLHPVSHGGGQEREVRSGTIPVAAAAALAEAIAIAVATRDAEAQRLSALADRLIEGVQHRIDGAVLRGGESRLPGHVLFTIDGADAEAVLFGLDMAGISAASGAACRAGVNQPSDVLLAMGLDEQAAGSGLRLTLGHTSTEAEVQALLAALPEVVRRARDAYSPRAAVEANR